MGREHSSEMETTPPVARLGGGRFSPSEPRGRRVATCGPRLSPLSRPGTHNALPAATPSFTRGRRGGLCVCVCALTTDFTAERRGFSVLDQPHATDQQPRTPPFWEIFPEKSFYPGFESAHRASKLPHEPSEIIYGNASRLASW